MTDRDELRGRVPEATPLDELASVLLDGEATDDEVARAGDPDVVARVERFAEIAAVVGAELPPPSARQRDAAVAAALAAWAPVAPTDELTERRLRRARTYRLVGAAAAVIAVMGLGTLVAIRTAGDRDTDTSVASDAPTEEAGTTAGATVGDHAGGADAAESTPAPSALPDLGAYRDVDALVLDSANQAASRASTTEGQAFDSTAAEPSTDRAGPGVHCATEVLGDRTPATILTATLGERDVVVFAIAATDATRVVVVDATTCEVLADRTP